MSGAGATVDGAGDPIVETLRRGSPLWRVGRTGGVPGWLEPGGAEGPRFMPSGGGCLVTADPEGALRMLLAPVAGRLGVVHEELLRGILVTPLRLTRTRRIAVLGRRGDAQPTPGDAARTAANATGLAAAGIDGVRFASAAADGTVVEQLVLFAAGSAAPPLRAAEPVPARRFGLPAGYRAHGTPLRSRLTLV